MGLKEDTESLMTLECKKEAAILVEEAIEAREGRKKQEYRSIYRAVSPGDMEVLIRARAKIKRMNEEIEGNPPQYRSHVLYRRHNFETMSEEPLKLREIFKS